MKAVPLNSQISKYIQETHITPRYLDELGVNELQFKCNGIFEIEIPDTRTGKKSIILTLGASNPKTGEVYPNYYLSSIEDKETLFGFDIKTVAPLQGALVTVTIKPNGKKRFVRIINVVKPQQKQQKNQPEETETDTQHNLSELIQSYYGNTDILPRIKQNYGITSDTIQETKYSEIKLKLEQTLQGELGKAKMLFESYTGSEVEQPTELDNITQLREKIEQMKINSVNNNG